jgi:O-antigen/teichoic acid export membrane protein
VVVILSLAMLFATASGPVDSVLLMAGRSWISLFNNTLALAVDVVLNIFLVPAYGATGAAISWAAAIVLRNVLPLLQVHRSMHMWPATRDSVHAGAAALVCFGVLGGGARLLGLPLPVVVVSVGAGGALYLAGMWLMRDRFELAAFGPALLGRRRRRKAQEEVPGAVRSSA